MKYYRLSQVRDATVDYWYMNLIINGYEAWELRMGKRIEPSKFRAEAHLVYGQSEIDFPGTDNHIPVVSASLRDLWSSIGLTKVQYLPLSIEKSISQQNSDKYYVANFLQVIDCLDREHSQYVVWTKENLLYWEKREWMLGTFRDVRKVILDSNKIENALAFRLWGWEVMLIVREDMKSACEQMRIKGCVFTEIQVS